MCFYLFLSVTQQNSKMITEGDHKLTQIKARKETKSTQSYNML